MCRRFRDTAFTRTDIDIGGGDMPREERLKAALLIRMNDAAAAIVQGCQVEAEGASAKPSAGSELWVNLRGPPIAALLGGGVTVHEYDVLNGLVSPNHFSFYVGDRRVLQVPRHLVGHAPNKRLLTGLWKVFSDGFAAGRRSGTKEGARDLKRQFRDLMRDDPEDEISVCMEHAHGHAASNEEAA